MKDIRGVRLSRQVSQRNLAKAIGISIKTLSQIERHLAIADVTIIEKAARYLDIDAADLYEVHGAIPEIKLVGEGYKTALQQQSFQLHRKVEPNKEKISIIDLFCGTGGFSHGFELTEQFQVTAGLDLLSDRVTTFSENHQAAEVFCEDITRFDFHRMADVIVNPQVIIGGPPCQGFSSIRPFRTLTQSDLRNNLFESFALAVEMLRPEWFVLENVVGLLKHQAGQTLQSMISLFEQLGYKIDWKIINAANYGLPQRRERLIIVGNSRRRKFIWPTPTHYVTGNFKSMAGKKYDSFTDLPLLGYKLQSAISVMQAIHDLPFLAAGEKSSQYREDVDLTPYEMSMRGNETELLLHEATTHSSHMLDIIRQAGYNRNDLPQGLTTSGFSTSYSRLEPNIPSVTLTVNFVHPASNKCIHPFQDRALTPREGARLQGFEDSYKFIGTRSQIVKQIGNAVPPILGKAIAESLLKQL